MSIKNKLQEYFQSRGEILPIYSTIRSGGEDHKPLWVSCVKLADGEAFKSSPMMSKKASQMDAASRALKKIEKIQTYQYLSDSPLMELTCNRKIIVLLDVENLPNVVYEFIENVKFSDVILYGFISEGHPLLQKLNCERDERVKLIIVPTTRKDGSDIGLSMAVGSILETTDYEIFLIVSKDHFADALVDCIKNYRFLPTSKREKKIKAFVCRSFEDMISKIDIW